MNKLVYNCKVDILEGYFHIILKPSSKTKNGIIITAKYDYSNDDIFKGTIITMDKIFNNPLVNDLIIIKKGEILAKNIMKTILCDDTLNFTIE